MKKRIFLFLCGCVALGLYAQTARSMDELLDSKEISWETAASFVLPAAGVLSESAGKAAAFAEARERGFLPKNAEASAPARLDGVSLLIMKSFGIKGGLMYRMLKNSRYAYRELWYTRCLPARSDPSFKLSGEDLLDILGKVLRTWGDGV
ncbi:MAG: hypothetical protein LBF78_14800 [Treponema sp.]|nr:hypothetical protein [Treponema sp.]